ncbi:ribokinase [Paenibacillus marchantiophytorum]|uniref:Ribokinase n=1 Tax=Paenibacillus marchantiophytorum TaxID=1619310 RepID=A0ABQ1ERY0_9BACL|nr:ribokinase [Paenibacillus marchantiophytorum]GFZ84715.1 ribokinase [Paenibacillus marchantiophytorum]
MNKPRIVVIGSLNMDIVVETSRFPRVGETLTGEHVHFIPGGKGANQAVAAARLGGQTTMIGSIGDDMFGQSLLQYLNEDAIVTDYIKQVPDKPTGIASIMLAESDNRIVVVPGANACCLPEHIQALESVIAEHDIVLVQLEIPLETASAACILAKKLGKIVILNPAPAQKLPANMLQSVDYITPNRLELATLTGIETAGDEQLQSAMEALLDMGPSCVVTTLGEEGSAFLRKGETIVKIPAYRVPVVDTTGAGDAYNGGLAYALAAGSSLSEAVQFASKVSAMSVTKLGAQAGMPTQDDLTRLPIQ